MTIKAVVFDMDGVLIDAREWHYEALNRALALFGYVINRAEHLETFDGLPTGRKLQILTRDQGLPAELHDFVNEMKQRYTVEMIYAYCRPRFAHQYALSKLKSEGLLLGLASNSIAETVDLMMEKANLSRYLDVQLSTNDVKKSKPDPEVYLMAMERLAVRPEETLVVEDNDHGVRAALAAGAHLLQVNDVYDVNYENISRRIRELSGER